MRICASGSSPSSRLRLRKPEPTRVVSWPGPRWLGVTRKLFPEAFHRLDAVCEGRFPFSAALVEAAHAKWTSEWLAWERQHDLDYKRRASAAEAELSRAGETDPATVRARLAAIDQENASIATTDTYLNPGRIHLARVHGTGRAEKKWHKRGKNRCKAHGFCGKETGGTEG